MKKEETAVASSVTIATLLVLTAGVVGAVEPATTGDLFDVSRGGVVTANSLVTLTPASNIIGGEGGVEPPNLLFGDGQPVGTVHFVEWETPGLVPLAGFNLYAVDDGVNQPQQVEFQRSFDHVRLLSDQGEGFEVFYEADIEIPYNGTSEQDDYLISEAITPVAASRFRAEFTQALDCGLCGPRVVELDGFPADPCADGNYSGTTTASDSLVALTSSVGLSGCPLCACDVDNNGSVTATDALAILTAAVGLPFDLDCPSCLAVPGSTTTTTTLPVSTSTTTTSTSTTSTTSSTVTTTTTVP